MNTPNISLLWRLPTKKDEFVGGVILNNEGELIADCNIYGVGKSDDEIFSNASFILQAVNSYYELLEACRKSINLLSHPEDVLISQHKRARELLQQALVHAEGGAQ